MALAQLHYAQDFRAGALLLSASCGSGVFHYFEQNSETRGRCLLQLALRGGLWCGTGLFGVLLEGGESPHVARCSVAGERSFECFRSDLRLVLSLLANSVYGVSRCNTYITHNSCSLMAFALTALLYRSNAELIQFEGSKRRQGVLRCCIETGA